MAYVARTETGVKMSCELCNDSGFIVDENNKLKKCKCVLANELKAFLKHYSKYTYNKKYANIKYLMDIVFEGHRDEAFGSLVKSFLSYLYLKSNDLKWKDITGQDLVSVTFGEDETYAIQDLQEVDFLIIKLGRDSFNRSLGAWLLNLITRRKELGNVTWIYIYPKTVTKIVDLYGSEFKAYIGEKTNFRCSKL